MNMDFVGKVKLFNEIAGTIEKFDSRNVALYMGLQLEEMAEKLESFNGLESGEHDKYDKLQVLVQMLTQASNQFKRGLWDDEASKIDRIAALDADIDLAVVALGGAISLGADTFGACQNVADSNLSKFNIVNGEFVVLKDENGKIRKPESYQPPMLAQFLRN